MANGSDLDPVRAAADYERTLTVWSQLVEVRFKLLALVPVVTGAGIGLLGNVDKVASLRVTLVAALGFATVMALMVYDVRNSMLHDAVVHRLKKIEKCDLLLERRTRRFEPSPSARWWSERKWPVVLDDTARGGVFADRPASVARLFGLRVQHDRALALVYVSSATAWSTMVAYSALGRLTDLESGDVLWWTFGITAGVALVLVAGYWWYGATARYVVHVLTEGDDPKQRWKGWFETTPPGSKRPQGWVASKFVARATERLREAQPAAGAPASTPTELSEPSATSRV